MELRYYPKKGLLLMCDFSGFKAPEMNKKREVIVLTARGSLENGLATVVPLSTTPPGKVENFHWIIPTMCLPNTARYKNSDSWLKGDMIYTVSFSRLSLINIGRNSEGKRSYHTSKLGKENMKKIHECLLHGLNLGHILKT